MSAENKQAVPAGSSAWTPTVVMVAPKWLSLNNKSGVGVVEQVYESLVQSGLATVHFFHCDEYYERNGERGDQALMELCQESGADLLFLNWAILNRSELNPTLETLLEIKRRLGIPLIAFWWDHVYGVHIMVAELLDPLVDLHVVCDASAFFPAVTAPEKCLFLWPPAQPYRFQPGPVQDIPISYIGRLNKPGRQEALAGLRSAGLSIYTGGGYDRGADRVLSWEAYTDICRRSQIVLNFSATITQSHQLTGRIMEALCSGAMLLQEESAEICGLLAPMVDFVPYRIDYARNGNVDDLIEKARYYLDHEEERRAIARSGYEKALRYYDYHVFWNTVLSHALSRW